MGIRFVGAAAALVAASFCASCTTSYRVHHLDDNARASKKIRTEGVEYALPRTVVEVTVPVTKVTPKRAGVWDDVIAWHKESCAKDDDSAADDKKIDEPIAKAYQKALKELLEPAQLKPGKLTSPVQYKLGSEIAITPLNEADPDQVYLIDLGRGAFEDRKTVVALSEAGLLTEVDSTVKNRGLEYTIKTVQAAAAIAGTFIGLPSPAGTVATAAAPAAVPPSLVRGDDENTGRITPNLNEQEPPEIQPCLGEFRSPERPWNQALHELVLLRVYRAALLTGGLNVADDIANEQEGASSVFDPFMADGAIKSIDKLLPLIDKRISELKAYFSGTKDVTEVKLAFLVRPDGDAGFSAPLLNMDKGGFRIPDVHGVTRPPLPAKFASGSPKSTLWLHLQPETHRQMADVINETRDPRGRAIKRGYAYRVPLTVRAEVRYVSEPAVVQPAVNQLAEAAEDLDLLVASAPIQMAQWGAVSRLPGHFSGADVQMVLKLYPDTGALQSFTLQGAPAEFSPQAPAGVQGAADSVLGAIAAKRTADQAELDSQSDLERKKRQLELLELEVKIKEQQDKLEMLDSDEGG